VPVDVSVKKVLRPVAIDQTAKTDEAPVAEVLPVVDVSRRCMTDHHIEALLAAQLRPKGTDEGSHLGFCILKRPPIVPVRSLEPQETDPVERDDTSVDVCAPVSDSGFQAQVVISPDIKKRHLKNFYEAEEILGGQISAGDEQLDIAESPVLRQLTEQGLYIVGNYKNLHDLHCSFDGWQLY
jgi:hypothetical protein